MTSLMQNEHVVTIRPDRPISWKQKLMAAIVGVGVFYVIISAVEVSFIFLVSFSTNEISQRIGNAHDFLTLVFLLLAAYTGFRIAVRIMRQ
jgi:hypothetical protein